MWVFLHGCSGLVLIWITSDYVAIGHDGGAGGLQTMLVFCAGRLVRRVLRKSSGRSLPPPASNLPYSPLRRTSMQHERIQQGYSLCSEPHKAEI